MESPWLIWWNYNFCQLRELKKTDSVQTQIRFSSTLQNCCIQWHITGGSAGGATLLFFLQKQSCKKNKQNKTKQNKWRYCYWELKEDMTQHWRLIYMSVLKLFHRCEPDGVPWHAPRSKCNCMLRRHELQEMWFVRLVHLFLFIFVFLTAISSLSSSQVERRFAAMSVYVTNAQHSSAPNHEILNFLKIVCSTLMSELHTGSKQKKSCGRTNPHCCLVVGVVITDQCKH